MSAQLIKQWREHAKTLRAAARRHFAFAFDDKGHEAESRATDLERCANQLEYATRAGPATYAPVQNAIKPEWRALAALENLARDMRNRARKCERDGLSLSVIAAGETWNMAARLVQDMIGLLQPEQSDSRNVERSSEL